MSDCEDSCVNPNLCGHAKDSDRPHRLLSAPAALFPPGDAPERKPEIDSGVTSAAAGPDRLILPAMAEYLAGATDDDDRAARRRFLRVARARGHA